MIGMSDKAAALWQRVFETSYGQRMDVMAAVRDADKAAGAYKSAAKRIEELSVVAELESQIERLCGDAKEYAERRDEEVAAAVRDVRALCNAARAGSCTADEAAEYIRKVFDQHNTLVRGMRAAEVTLRRVQADGAALQSDAYARALDIAHNRETSG